MSAPKEIAISCEDTKYTFLLSESVALRVNLKTGPQNTKTAKLQKGVTLVYDGEEVAGEGTGFGVPILKYADETYFSGSSTLKVQKQGNLVVIQKEFDMDMVERTEFRNLSFTNGKLRELIDSISALYQRHRRLARLILLAKSLLFEFGVKESFGKTRTKGKVAVTYTIFPSRLLVRVECRLVNRINLERIFVLNEQSALFFRTYSDSDGSRLIDEEIGAWQPVTANSAKIADCHGRVGFSLKTIRGSQLRRGREFLANSLDWVGLDYELSPASDSFEYGIELFEGRFI
jgi:hypothetical protein